MTKLDILDIINSHPASKQNADEYIQDILKLFPDTPFSKEDGFAIVIKEFERIYANDFHIYPYGVDAKEYFTLIHHVGCCLQGEKNG